MGRLGLIVPGGLGFGVSCCVFVGFSRWVTLVCCLGLMCVTKFDFCGVSVWWLGCVLIVDVFRF